MDPIGQAEIRLGLRKLERRLEAARLLPEARRVHLPDAEVFLKGVRWGLDYDEPALTAADRTLMLRALARGQERAEALLAGSPAWGQRKGRLVRGYRSRVDGSVQPYALIVPAGYSPGRPMRLDVVLHGSTRPVGMSELRFVMPFDEGDGPAAVAPQQDWLELRPLGRVENCYRWAGETDVFEAIEDVCRHYTVDRDRIVLRGMSMGASGAWHLGLKHPDMWAAIGPYCGYVDTLQFSRTPLPNFIPVGPLPPHQERILPLLDSVGYAANAAMVPSVAAMGEKDVFFQAHVIMGEAFRKAGLEMVNLISPGTGHVQDPVTHAEQLRRIAAHTGPGMNRQPDRVRFVTHSLRYPRCRWVEVLRMGQHYRPAEVRAEVRPGEALVVEQAVNVDALALGNAALARAGGRVRIAGQELRLSSRAIRNPEGQQRLERAGARWRPAGTLDRRELRGKRPGIQGPIDDAFMKPFVCVRPTGTAWNPGPATRAVAVLDRFAPVWRRYMRGELPVVADRDVTPEMLRDNNLILFGDPGSNPWIRRALDRLPLRWTRDRLELAGRRYDAHTHFPRLIAPSPFAHDRYVVLNSGHSFGEKEFASLNYLLFPRLGDWAVERTDIPPSAEDGSHVVTAGYFDEDWR